MKGTVTPSRSEAFRSATAAKAAALSAEMGPLSRSIPRRSGQNCKIIKIIQILVLQFYRQLVKKSKGAFLTSCLPAGIITERRGVLQKSRAGKEQRQ